MSFPKGFYWGGATAANQLEKDFIGVALLLLIN